MSKVITILRMHPGVENQEQALEVFKKVGPAPGTEWILASRDAQTYFSLADLDSSDIATLAAYSPFFSMETLPVVEIDGDWVAQMDAGIAKRG